VSDRGRIGSWVLRGRTSRRLCLAVTVVVLATATSGAAVAPGAAAGTAAIALGVYAGPANVAGVSSFATTTGTTVSVGIDYLSQNAGWSGMDGAGGSLDWLTSAWAKSGDQLMLGVPMIPTEAGTPVGTLAGGAAGDYDAVFVTLAQTLVAAGLANAALRLGWEFDGTWTPWAVRNATDAANFAAYWRNIVTAMRSVPGADFRFVWNPAGLQANTWSLADAYPGDGYVDAVGFDLYDQSWDPACFPGGDPNNSATPAQSNCVFHDMVTNPNGLGWLASFAQAHAKPIVIPEWGVVFRSDGHGLGDDPTFVANLANWMIANHVTMAGYFNANTSSMQTAITDGNFPNALAAFETTFGQASPGTSAAGATSGGASPPGAGSTTGSNAGSASSAGSGPAPTTANVSRIAGPDAIGTAIAISQASYPAPLSAGAVVLARSDFLSDALAGGPLAAKLHAPLLLTPGTPLSASLDPRVETEIERVLPPGGTVYLLGGPEALSPEIDATLDALGYHTERIAGADEYATAVDIAEALGNPHSVMEVTGVTFTDAMSAVPAAIETGSAILLTDGSTQAPETAAYLAAHPDDQRYAIGGPTVAAGADPTATAIYGASADDTSAAVAETFFPHPKAVGVTADTDPSDGLTAGPMLGNESLPLLLVPASGPVPSSVASYLAATGSSVSQATIFGGPLALADAVLGEIAQLIG